MGKPVRQPQDTDGAVTAPSRRGNAQPGLLSRLFGFARGSRAGPIQIRIARLVVESEQAAPAIDYSRQVAASLDKGKGVKARPLNKTLELSPIGNPVEHMARAEATARKWLAAADADLLIWGEVPAPGTTLHLRFIPALADAEDRPGAFNPFTTLNLPVDFGPEYAPILLAVSLAATVPRSEEKRRRLIEGISNALSAAMPAVKALPVDLTTRERAAIQVCFANAMTTLAGVRGGTDLLHSAAQTYQKALENLSRDDHPLDWGIAHKHLGEILQSLSERDNDPETLEKAADAFIAAARILTRKEFPREWAAIQNRLGQVLYRLQVKTGDTEVLKHALTSFQSALQVITRADAPLRWAEVMSNFVLATHELGGHLKSPKVLEKAVEACRSVLEVRTRDKIPHQWATVQNNLGSSLFMLGKLTGKAEHLNNAAEAFRLANQHYTQTGAAKMAAITEKNLSHVERLLEKLAPKPVPKVRWETDAAPAKDKD